MDPYAVDVAALLLEVGGEGAQAELAPWVRLSVPPTSGSRRGVNTPEDTLAEIQCLLGLSQTSRSIAFEEELARKNIVLTATTLSNLKRLALGMCTVSYSIMLCLQS